MIFNDFHDTGLSIMNVPMLIPIEQNLSALFQ